MNKIDLKKTDKPYYTAAKNAQIIELQPAQYISVTGKGDPENEPFQRAIEQVYKTAYGLKRIKKTEDSDFVVPKMECFWWLDVGHDFVHTPRDLWNWKIRIRMPDIVTKNDFGNTEKEDSVAWESIAASQAIQVLHLGPYEAEQPSVEKILKKAEELKMKIAGHHLEIYISDPRKTPKEKLKTILRYQVA